MTPEIGRIKGLEGKNAFYHIVVSSKRAPMDLYQMEAKRGLKLSKEVCLYYG